MAAPFNTTIWDVKLTKLKKLDPFVLVFVGLSLLTWWASLRMAAPGTLLDNGVLAVGLLCLTGGIVWWCVRAPAARLRRHRRRSGLCEICGYDLRESPERCPECGNMTWQHRRELAAATLARVTADVACVRCRGSLRDRPISGACPQCGHSVRLAILEHVVDVTGHSHAQVRLVWNGCVYALRRHRSNRSDMAAHLDARGLCMGIRDYAIQRAGGREAAMAWLVGMGFESSEDIGRIVFAMTHVGLFKVGPEDDPKDFVGLFTLEEMFSAKAVEG